MQYLDRIDAIEARARAINLTLGELAKDASVHPSTVMRWRSGTCDPKHRTLQRILGRLEDALEKRELAILTELKSRFCDRPAA